MISDPNDLSGSEPGAPKHVTGHHCTHGWLWHSLEGALLSGVGFLAQGLACCLLPCDCQVQVRRCGHFQPCFQAASLVSNSAGMTFDWVDPISAASRSSPCIGVTYRPSNGQWPDHPCKKGQAYQLHSGATRHDNHEPFPGPASLTRLHVDPV